MHVELGDCIAKMEFHGIQYYFAATMVGGIFGNGRGEEYTNENRGRGMCTPVWVELEKLSFINVRPVELVQKIQRHFSNA